MPEPPTLVDLDLEEQQLYYKPSAGYRGFSPYLYPTEAAPLSLRPKFLIEER